MSMHDDCTSYREYVQPFKGSCGFAGKDNHPLVQLYNDGTLQLALTLLIEKWSELRGQRDVSLFIPFSTSEIVFFSSA